MAYFGVNQGEGQNRGGGEGKVAGEQGEDDGGVSVREGGGEEDYDYILNIPHLKQWSELRPAHSGNSKVPTPPSVHKHKVALATTGGEEPEKVAYEHMPD